jgi:ArsR family transcriptional regulator, cadmium/lead-responsive transcriptional repressor
MLTIASRVEVMTRLGRAMADPTRARILMSLVDEPGYPALLAQELELTRTNVSNHLACLLGCGLITAEPAGRRTMYRIADPHLGEAISLLLDVVVAVDDGSGCLGQDCPLGCCGAEERP